MDQYERIYKMSYDDIKYHYKDIINSLISSFNYANLSSDEIEARVLEAISETKRKLNRKNANYFNAYFKRKLTDTFNFYIINNIYKDNGRVKEILEDLIRELGEWNSYSEARSKFKSLANTLAKISLYPNIEIYIDLLKSNIVFKSLLETVCSRHIEQIKAGKIGKVFAEDELDLVYAYCTYKNIDIEYKVKDIKNSPFINTNDIAVGYKQEISRIDLLSILEEKELGMKMYNGNLAKSRLLDESLSEDERKELEEVVKLGEHAKTKFIEANLRLVIPIARSFIGSGMDFLDLVQEGNLGLIKAADRYDVTLGFKFSTFATWWIREYINRSIKNQSRSVRVPSYVYDNYRVIKRAKREIFNSTGREATCEEISSYTGIKVDEVKFLISTFQSVMSISAPINSVNNKSDSTLEEVLEDKNGNIENDFIESDLKDTVLEAFEECNLTERERFVLIRRMGLYGENIERLESIGKKLGISRQAVEQIEKRGLNKLYNNTKIRSCSSYLDVDYNNCGRTKKTNNKIKSSSESNKAKKKRLEKRRCVFDLLREYDRELIERIAYYVLDEDDYKILEIRNGSRKLDDVGSGTLDDNQKWSFKMVINKLRRYLKEYSSYKDNNRINKLLEYVDADAMSKLDFLDVDSAIYICMLEGYNINKKRYNVNELASMLDLDVLLVNMEVQEALKKLRGYNNIYDDKRLELS